MKKLITLIIFVSLALFYNNSIHAGDRMMLIEFFTSSTCNPCASNNPVMTAFLNSQDPTRITSIGFHMNWPSPGNDPMFLYNQNDNTARRGFYNINSIPTGRFDGIIDITTPYAQATLQSFFDQRKNILSPITIILSDSLISTDSVLVRAKIFCETYLANPTVNVFIALTEKHIHYTSAPGTNGEVDFYNVMRKLYPTSSGASVSLYPGQMKIVEQKYKIDPVWQWSEMEPLAFVQDASKEILNAARKTSDFALLVNPGFRVIPQGVSGNENYKIRIPVIGSSFNSPVTFTAEVSPVTSGINATFNNGNVISNFSDSLNLQVTSSASVPAGVYKIIATGTSASGKVHKISMEYLVGKNYVTVRANYPQLNYKVNNVAYSTPKTFTWDLNSQQTITATSPQSFSTSKYIFLNWSNGGDTNQTITVNANTSEYVANYKQQFRVLTTVSPAGLPVTFTNGGIQFIDSSNTLNISVSPAQLQYNNKTYYFNNWIGVGNGSYSGNNTSFQISINNFINEVAVYDTIDVGITQNSTNVPDKYMLHQNYPNPFNPVTKIKFDLKKSGMVKIVVYNILGKEIYNIYSGYLSAGKFETNFNAGNIASGIYFYKLETENFVDIKKMVILK